MDAPLLSTSFDDNDFYGHLNNFCHSNFHHVYFLNEKNQLHVVAKNEVMMLLERNPYQSFPNQRELLIFQYIAC